MPSLGPMEIMVILVVALLVLGPKKLPEAGRQVGKAMAEFRRWSNEIQGEMRSAVSTDVGPDYGASVPSQTPAQTAEGGGASASPNGKVDTPAGPRPPSQFPDGQSFN